MNYFKLKEEATDTGETPTSSIESSAATLEEVVQSSSDATAALEVAQYSDATAAL